MSLWKSSLFTYVGLKCYSYLRYFIYNIHVFWIIWDNVVSTSTAPVLFYNCLYLSSFFNSIGCPSLRGKEARVLREIDFCQARCLYLGIFAGPEQSVQRAGVRTLKTDEVDVVQSIDKGRSSLRRRRRGGKRGRSMM